jgi:hypothetical protein
MTIISFRLNGMEKSVAQTDPKARIRGHQLRELLKLESTTDLYVDDDLSEDGERPIEKYELLRLRNGMSFTTREPD